MFQNLCENDPDSWDQYLNQVLALAIANKPLDKNRFRNVQKTTDHPASDFKEGDRDYFMNKQPGKWDLKWRAIYGIVHIEHDGHYLHIENQGTGRTQYFNVNDVLHEPPVELCNVDTQFGRVGKFMNYTMNLPTITLHDA